MIRPLLPSQSVRVVLHNLRRRVGSKGKKVAVVHLGDLRQQSGWDCCELK